LQKTVAGSAVVPGVGRARVTQDLNIRRLVGQQRRDVREGVGCPSLPVRVQVNRTKLATKLQCVFLLDEVEIVDQGKCVIGIRLAPAVLGTVAADEITKRCSARRSALAADARNRYRTRKADRKRAGIDPWNCWSDAVDARLVAIEAQLGFINNVRV